MEDEPILVPYPVVDIPSPFLKYFNEPWFPKHVYTDIDAVVATIISNLNKCAKEDLSDMLQCILDAHR